MTVSSHDSSAPSPARAELSSAGAAPDQAVSPAAEQVPPLYTHYCVGMSEHTDERESTLIQAFNICVWLGRIFSAVPTVLGSFVLGWLFQRAKIPAALRTAGARTRAMMDGGR